MDVSFGPPQHVLRDGQFYTSTDQSPLPSPIPSLNELQPEPSIKDLRSQLWSLDKYPYLAFIFNSPAAFGPLMRRFAHFDPSVLTCSSSTGLWHLPKDTAKEWKLFEQSIRLVAEKLQLYFTTQNPSIPVIWEAPAKPTLFGYFIPHATREAATVAINDSIDGFIVYAATMIAAIWASMCVCSTSYPQLAFKGRFTRTAPVNTSRSSPAPAGTVIFTTRRPRSHSFLHRCKLIVFKLPRFFMY